MHSFPGSCLAWGNPALGSTDSMVGLMVNSKRVYTKGDLPVPPFLQWAPADPRLHRRPSNTSFSLWCRYCCSPLGLRVLRILFVPSKTGVSVFPQSSGKAIIKSRWPSRPDSLGIPSPFVRSPGWEASCRVQKLHNSARTSLALLFSSLWITHLVGLGFSFYCDRSPPRLAVTSSLSLDVGCLFFGGFQHPPVDGCSTAHCNFGALTEGGEHTSFYSTILNRNQRIFRKLQWRFRHSPCRKGMSTCTQWSMLCMWWADKGTVAKGCSNKLPHASSHRNSFCHSSGDPKSEFSVTGLKPSCWQGQPPNRGSKGKTLLVSSRFWWLLVRLSPEQHHSSYLHPYYLPSQCCTSSAAGSMFQGRVNTPSK